MLKLLQQSCQELVSISKLSRILSLSVGRYSSSVTSALEQPQGPSNTEKNADLKATESLVSEALVDHSGSYSNSESRRNGFLNEQEENFAPFRYVYPEFLPDPNLKWRNRVREKLERMDMLKRRGNIEIPEFYVGSILSVTVSDRQAPTKTNTFVGLCTEREGTALRSTFTLRNVIDGHGVEITYDLFNPTIMNITCLRLEKRLDDNLRYLRDCPQEYSTVPFDMVPELRAPDAPVPINPIKVKLSPHKPWSAKWHLWDLKGVEDLSGELEPWQATKLKRWTHQTGFDTQQYDLMKSYRSTIPAEEQTEIYSEVHQQLQKLTASLRKLKKKRTFVKPQKTV